MKNILIVDDESYVRTLFTSVVELFEDYRVDTATNGYEAIQKIMNSKYDLILMDLKMPKMSGIEAIRAIRLLQDKTPIVIITGYASEKMKEEGMEAGANLFLSKPVSIKELKGHIRYYAEEYTIEEEEFNTESFEEDFEIESNDIDKEKVIVIASSNGGPMDFIQMIGMVEKDKFPPIIVAQHMPEGFIEPVSEEVARKSGKKVVVVNDQEKLEDSTIYYSSDHQSLIIDNGIIKKERAESSTHFLPSISKTITSFSDKYKDNCIIFLYRGLSVHLDSKEGLIDAKKNRSRVFALNDSSNTVKKMASNDMIEGLSNISGLAKLIDKFS